MLCSKRWLDSLVKIDDSPKGFSDKMTMSGSKVEGYEVEGESMSGIVLGEVKTITRHENADNLLITTVDVGNKTAQVLTAAKNLKVGDKVPVALPGSVLANGTKIESRQMKGELSEGMLCSLGELGLTQSDFPYAVSDGIFAVEEPGSIGDDIRKVIGLDDTVFEFEITPNRPDCLSMIGLAREAAATYDKSFEPDKPAVKGSGGDINELVSVSVESELCRRYTAKAVKNVKIAPSPRWMRERLRAAGMRPINNIVDITNYVMLEYGQPLHAFNYTELPDGKIIVRNARDGETLTTLDGVERKLSPDMLMICDINGPTGVAGVMGGLGSGISDDTNIVVFESASFDNVSIRLTSRKLGLRSESSSRFEKGLDSRLCPDAALRACELVELLGCGEVVDGIIDVDNASFVPTKLELNAGAINGLLGTDIKEETMISILRQLGFTVETGASLPEITVPSYRADVEMGADIAEEIARIYGYNNIPNTRIQGAVAGALTERQIFERDVNATLVGLGLNEILTYTFISPKAYDRIALPKDSDMRKSVVVTNPLGEDTSLMRRTALPSMMDILARNYNNRNSCAYIYEMAKTFTPNASVNELPIEEYRVTIGLYDSGADYYTLKGVVESLIKSLKIDSREVSYKACSIHPTFHPGRCAELYICGKLVGVMGEVHPSVTSGYSMDVRCCMADLSSDLLYELSPREILYKSMPRYPASTRDLALTCGAELPVETIEKTIWGAVPDILESVSLFDIYEGAQVQSGKKSVAYSLVFRSAEGTLSDDKVESAVKNVLSALSEIGAEIRS